jgi:alkanesulfonate monooxygenase
MIKIRTQQRTAEIAWFDDLCGGDTAYLGNLDPKRRSTFEHCGNILKTADRLGYNNILLPTSYVDGQEVLPFAAALAPQTKNINLLTAIRTGEIHPPMLARHLATLDHILKGRLTVNIINSELPGLKESTETRYQRCAEVIEILQQAWTKERIQYDGQFYKFDLPTAPVKPYQNGGPMLYFGGIAPGSRDLCARYCDVFLMWPEPEYSLQETMKDLSNRAAAYGRTIDFGFRVHVIVRKTEKAARQYAEKLISKFDEKQGEILKNRTQDAQSAGVLRQNAFRESSENDYLEPLLWGGIGRARSGCGAAIVGDPDQVLEKINRYIDMGFRSFIFSGYPLLEECKLFAKYVLPYLPNEKLNNLRRS